MDATQDQDIDRRLEALEVKAAFTEDLLEQLNMTIYRQQQRIDGLVQQLVELRRQTPDDAAGARSARDELPPHY
ncbi:MAG: SlyX protein [Variovorax sp.]|jgi:SlyX protein|nr:SlyX protein [Variovorax sp.]